MLKNKQQLKLFLILSIGIWLGSQEGFAALVPGYEPSIAFQVERNYPIQPMPLPLWILEEGTESLSIEDVRSGDWKDARWIDLTTNRNQKSSDFGSYWFRIELSSEMELSDWKVLVERYNPNTWYDVDQAISRLHAYYFKGEDKIGEGFSGREMPTSKRDLKDLYYQSILVLDLEVGEKLDIWINFQGPKGYISPIVQLHPADFQIMRAPWPFKLTTYNFYLGFLCTLLIIGFFLLIWFKGEVYVWFLGFIILNILTITYWRNSTPIIHWFFPENSVNYQQFGFMLDMTKWGILILFGRIFIQTKKFFPKIDKILLITGIAFILLSVVMIAIGVRPDMKEQSLILLVFFGAIMLSILVVFGYLIFSKNTLARFFSIGAIIPFIGIGLIGGFREMLWVRNLSELLMSLGPMITLTLAIVYRFKQEASGRIQAEKEKTSLLENQTILLEKQVNSRTAELSASLERLKSTQEQLVQQEKLASLGQLTAGIAHEIKNPLNFVNNFSEVSLELIDEALEELASVQTRHALSPDDASSNESDSLADIKDILSDVQSNLSKIHQHGSRANGIVSSMLQHSRGGSGKMEPTDLNALVKEYVNLAFHGMRAGKNPIDVDIKLDFDEKLGKVNLIGEDFSRVVLNLCNNAFDAMREKVKMYQEQSTRYKDGKSEFEAGKYVPELAVSTKQNNGMVTISVTDNGPGIPDEIKDKILQPFFTTKKGTEGTGLGLSITHDIIKAHGGEMRIESKVDHGTTFMVQIPITV